VKGVLLDDLVDAGESGEVKVLDGTLIDAGELGDLDGSLVDAGESGDLVEAGEPGRVRDLEVDAGD
jgi:hypothetical protein